jgi:predicted transcriptional regulator
MYAAFRMVPVSSSPPVSTLTRMSSTLKDLFIYIYDLTPLDMDVLIILVKNNSGKTKKKPLTLENISKDANRDKTSVFRSLQKLVNLGICNKEAKTQKGGGLYHVYSAIDMQIFKMETEKRVKELEASFRRILKQFEQDMDNMMKTFYQA